MAQLQRDLRSSRDYVRAADFITAHRPPPNPPTASAPKPRVLIVGAGAAGLRCADVLLAAGADVTVHEARHRVGGRLAQATVGGHRVDLGPNWIHGVKDNPIMRLMWKVGAPVYQLGEEQAVWDPAGRRMGAAAVAYYSGLFAEILAAGSERSGSGAEIPPEASLWDWVVEKSEEHFRREALDEAVVKERSEIVVGMAQGWGNMIGDPIHRQSLRFLWMEENLDADNLFAAGTYADVLREIARAATDQGVVRFGKDVVNISCSGAYEARKVLVSTSDGEVEEFDDVVVTCPLGWLKQNSGACFSPPLPTQLQGAIDSLGYGCLDKIYITFPKAFWNEPQRTRLGITPSDILFPEDQRSNTPDSSASESPAEGDGPPTARSSDRNPTGSTARTVGLPTILSWTTPSYAPDTNPGSWTQEAINLANLPNSSAHPTLLFYIHGPCSRHIADLLRPIPPDTAARPASHDVDPRLHDFLRPYLATLPNYDPADRACHPTAILATLWAADPHSGHGSYTNFPVGLTRATDDLLLLRGEPRSRPPTDGDDDGGAEVLARRGVWLAGEHTAPIIAVGTVAGAYMAGENVARKLMATWGRYEAPD